MKEFIQSRNQSKFDSWLVGEGIEDLDLDLIWLKFYAIWGDAQTT